MRLISFEEYLEKERHLPLLDVRSPGEYAKGHVPDALNLPLFDDEERAEVGTLYKQKGSQAALMRGLDIAGAKMTGYVSQAQRLVKGNAVAVHCWRGGRRSSSIATLLEFMGYETALLKGGYKAYRQLALKSFFDKKLHLIVLGGATGSGKTETLRYLRAAGEQVVDLEGLARHKGSAFGALGQHPQPTVEQFENDLFEQFRQLNPAKRTWVENESKSIGRVFIPEGFWQQMNSAVFIEMELPFQVRLQRLVEEYGEFSKEELLTSLHKISKRLGGLHVKNATAAFSAGEVENAASIVLNYYDKAYRHATQKKPFIKKHTLQPECHLPEKMARQLIQFADDNDY
ncbi:MAG TPA: tRNA 2-selenouridine(34) synthase MnmH [Bacteroidetes bacterium]|nr:tRNA 2-selenouridine(34) synthase MnmH [Bacteroidota bacterium]